MISNSNSDRPLWRPADIDGTIARKLITDLHLPDLLATLLANRGISTAEEARLFLDPQPEDFHDPFLLPDMDVAANRIAKAARDGETLLIHGDADVDGLSGTALLHALCHYIRLKVHVHVPNRAYESYSFSERSQQVIEQVGASVAVPVDNGTSSVEPVEKIQASGVDVIITDHHLPGSVLPPALAVVNPKRQDCTYPFKHLAGVGVAFKLACAVANRLQLDTSQQKKMRLFLGEAMAWAAIGTIADVVPLRGENRILVALGLKAVGRTGHHGLRALCAISKLRDGRVTPSDVAFQLAPRINAAGRMGREKLAIDLVLSSTEKEANNLAKELDSINKARQKADKALLNEIVPRVEAMPHNTIAMFHADTWIPGILGLVAGRIARRYHRPAVLISFQNGATGKGSIRSIPGFDAYKALSHCSQHLEEYGGHPMAAGFSVHRDHLDNFRRTFSEYWKEAVDRGLEIPSHIFESEVPLSGITANFVRNVMGQLEPYGEGNPRPLLGCQGVTVSNARPMGDGSHYQADVEHEGTTLRAIAFDRGEWVHDTPPGTTIDILFHPTINRFRGNVELELVDIRAVTTPNQVAPTSPTKTEPSNR